MGSISTGWLVTFHAVSKLGFLSATSLPFSLTAGGTTAVGTIRLTQAPGRITGVILSSLDGGPLAEHGTEHRRVEVIGVRRRDGGHVAQVGTSRSVAQSGSRRRWWTGPLGPI